MSTLVRIDSIRSSSRFGFHSGIQTRSTPFWSVPVTPALTILRELTWSRHRPLRQHGRSQLPQQSGRCGFCLLKVISRLTSSSHIFAERMSSGIHNHRRRSPIQLLFSGSDTTATTMSTSTNGGDDGNDLFCGRKSFFDEEDLCAILSNPNGDGSTTNFVDQQQISRSTSKYRCGAFHLISWRSPCTKIMALGTECLVK